MLTMKRQIFTVATVTAVTAMIVLTMTLTAYRAPESDSVSGPPVKVITVGNETVALTPLERSARLFSSLPEFVSTAPVVVEGRVTRTTSIVAEVQPSPNREGALPGEGPDLYGAIDFEVVSVLNGNPDLKNLRLVYQSGKRDGDNRSRRITYTHDELSTIQLPDGELRPAGELANKTFILFIRPNGPGSDIPSNVPVQGNTYALSTNGIAEVMNNGQLKFGASEKAPVAPDNNPAKRITISVTDVKAAVR